MVLSKVEGLMALRKAEGPFDRPFGRLTVLSKVEGRRCLGKQPTTPPLDSNEIMSIMSPRVRSNKKN